jgi:hypothetical protein
MSIKISSSEQICKHPGNTSTAKALYSFPKEKRFRKRKDANLTASYNVPSSFKTVELKSSFSKNKVNPGSSFGCGGRPDHFVS